MVLFNPLTAKLLNWNFHSVEVVDRVKMSENYSNLKKWSSTNFKSCWIMSLFIFNMFKSWYVMCYKKCKKRIWTAPAVKGLTMIYICINHGDHKFFFNIKPACWIVFFLFFIFLRLAFFTPFTALNCEKYYFSCKISIWKNYKAATHYVISGPG